MNVPVELIAVLCTAILGLQGWMLVEIVNLRTKVAVLTDHVFPKKDDK